MAKSRAVCVKKRARARFFRDPRSPRKARTRGSASSRGTSQIRTPCPPSLRCAIDATRRARGRRRRRRRRARATRGRDGATRARDGAAVATTDAGRSIADNHRRHRRRRSGTAGVARERARARTTRETDGTNFVRRDRRPSNSPLAPRSRVTSARRPRRARPRRCVTARCSARARRARDGDDGRGARRLTNGVCARPGQRERGDRGEG